MYRWPVNYVELNGHRATLYRGGSISVGNRLYPNVGLFMSAWKRKDAQFAELVRKTRRVK